MSENHASAGELVAKKRKEKILNVVFCVGTLLFYMAFFYVKAYGGAADTMWTTISELIGTWVLRLGGVVMFVGGIMFGLGWKNDDAEQKSRGIQTLIAGAIVTALAAMVDTFFSPE